MVTENAVKYLKKNGKAEAYICGDKNKRSCGLDGELTDLKCGNCEYSSGQMGVNTINEKALIYYNSDGFFTYSNEKNDKP